MLWRRRSFAYSAINSTPLARLASPVRRLKKSSLSTRKRRSSISTFSPSGSISSAESQTSTQRVSRRAASEYVEGNNLVEMIKENLVAERVAIETYREMVRHFGDNDPTTRVLLERIVAQ